MISPRRSREWPLVLGMILAALLVFASTRVAAAGNNAAPPPAPKTTGLTGFAASPIEARPATGATPRTSAKPRPAKPPHVAAKPKHAPAKHLPEGHASPAAADPSASTGGSAETPPQPREHAPVKHESSHQQQPADTPASTPAPAPPPALTVPGKSGQATSGGVTFTIRSPTHFPAAGSKWSLGVSAVKAGKPVTGSVQMNVVYQGKVAAKMASGPLSGGAFEKKVDWPTRSVGYPITIRVKIHAGGQRCVFLYDLKVRAASTP